jgi:hypothetical protein
MFRILLQVSGLFCQPPSFILSFCHREQSGSSPYYALPLRLKLNETHQLLLYADDVNLLRDNIDTLKKNTKILIGSSKEVGL